MDEIKENFRRMVIEKYLDRKGIKDIDSLEQITIDDLNMNADKDFERLMNDKEKKLIERETNKAKIEAKLKRMVDRTSFSMKWDIRS